MIMSKKYSLKSGLSCFGEKGEHVVSSDINQLHDMDTFTLVEKNKLSRKEIAQALAPLILQAEKKDDSIKVQICADGRKQK